MGGPGSGPKRKEWSPDYQWRGWYWTQRWRRRSRHQLRIEPVCRMCAARGLVVPATIADHVEHHGGDRNKFWLGKLQSLCKPCHDGPRKVGYSPEVGDDGWPLDPNHPANIDTTCGL
jgi:5-methylcytosine-specific restriction protein A